MDNTFKKFVIGGEVNLYGPPTSRSGDTRRSFTSVIHAMAKVGIAAAIILNIVVPQASAAELSDQQARVNAAVERIESKIGLERNTQRMAESQVAACYLVRVTDAQRNNGGPDLSIGDRTIPKVLYVRVTSCELSEEIYARRKAEFERQTGIVLDGPGVDVRDVGRKANRLGIDIQKPMTKEEAIAVRDSGNERIAKALEDKVWSDREIGIEDDGIHLSIGYQPF